MNETLPDPGDDLEPVIPVDRILAYGVGELPGFAVEALALHREVPAEDDGRRDRPQIRVGGQWVDL
jgi:hypothetical protein